MPLPAEPASRLPVVVTRPLQQAQAFADAVRQLGRAAVVFPLLQIAPGDEVGPLRATPVSFTPLKLPPNTPLVTSACVCTFNTTTALRIDH